MEADRARAPDEGRALVGKRLRFGLCLCLCLCLLVAGCGDDGKPSSPRPATVVLDFVPNAVHAGIYRAIAAGYYADEGLKLRVASPSSTADAAKLVPSGKADIGLADAIDVARLRAKGRDVRAFLAIVQRPLGGLVTRCDEHLASAAALEGRKVGVTGVPSDDAVLDSVVTRAGGDPEKVKRIAIGFGGVQALAGGKVDAFTGFWPADAPTLEATGHPACVFKLDDRGGPRYPGLVAFSAQRTMAKRGDVLRAFVRATEHGYDDVIANPAQGLRDLEARNPGLKGKVAKAQLDEYLPLFKADAPRFGVIRDAGVQSLSDFLSSAKLVPAPFTAEQFATNRFAG